MASYGMAAGEAVRLRLEDIDWRSGCLRIVRSKTGVETLLPLLPDVGQAIAAFVRRGRPRTASCREVFVRARAPHRALSSRTAGTVVTGIVNKYAGRAGIKAAFLGSHALRHAHASRQVDLGVPLKVLSDILGHQRPATTSIYVRVATKRLREVALPVPS
jgi:integrase